MDWGARARFYNCCYQIPSIRQPTPLQDLDLLNLTCICISICILICFCCYQIPSIRHSTPLQDVDLLYLGIHNADWCKELSLYFPHWRDRGFYRMVTILNFQNFVFKSMFSCKNSFLVRGWMGSSIKVFFLKKFTIQIVQWQRLIK